MVPFVTPFDILAAVLLGGGLLLFWRGFRVLRLRRLILGMAPSKARSVAMGLVELNGFAATAEPLRDPIFEDECVYYDVQVQEQRGSGRDEHWVEVYRRTSDTRPFYLSDDTGKVAVYPHGAQVYMDYKVDLRTGGMEGLFPDPNDKLARFAAAFGGGFTKVRIRARILHEYEPVYVLGYAVAAAQPFTLGERVGLTLADAARRLKADPEWMKRIDKNHDGVVDEQEWDEGLRAYQKNLQDAEDAVERSEAEAAEKAGAPKVLIRQGPDGLLVLADKTEKDFVAELWSSSALHIIGGPVVALVAGVFLAVRFGLLR